MEKPEEKFKRIAEKRVKRILNDIRVLGNCANRRVYFYTDAQVEKVFGTIQKRLDTTRAKFAPDRDIDFEL